ncbi:putative transferase [Rosa chinensis]|uniref:Putative transferase n=1 Tax=Rosa chinensis TaxID=74649 RepID=A0A2P6RRX4_ROSCH|nr:putative transferase [Rosa chinensis]
MDNHFFGPIPEELGRCKSLVKMRLMKNTLNGTIPAGIFSLPDVNIIELADNYLSGELPMQMSGAWLETLTLSNNQISGRIPSAIGNLPHLQILHLQMNRFSGKVQEEIFNLPWLAELNIRTNNFGGEIPASISGCSSLTSLDFSQNNFVGEIPRGIGKLKVIELLNFSRNKLTGPIPVEFTYMASLKTLDLSYNNFIGRIPTGGQFLELNASFEGNPHLSSHSSNKVIIAGLTGALLTLLLMLLLIYVLIRVYRKRKNSKIQKCSSWNLTVFQVQLDLNIEDVLQCLNALTHRTLLVGAVLEMSTKGQCQTVMSPSND